MIRASGTQHAAAFLKTLAKDPARILELTLSCEGDEVASVTVKYMYDAEFQGKVKKAINKINKEPK